MTDTRLFNVHPQNHIFTGLSESGLQMLVAQGFDREFVVVYFDDDGSCLRWEDYPNLTMKYDISQHSRDYNTAYRAKVQTIVRELGLVSQQPIRVQKFFIAKHMIGIRQYPNLLQRFLPQIEYSPEEVEALRETRSALIRAQSHWVYACFLPEEHLYGYDPEHEAEEAAFFEEWTLEGNYVLYCQNDFWCNRDGAITAT